MQGRVLSQRDNINRKLIHIHQKFHKITFMHRIYSSCSMLSRLLAIMGKVGQFLNWRRTKLLTTTRTNRITSIQEESLKCHMSDKSKNQNKITIQLASTIKEEKFKQNLETIPLAQKLKRLPQEFEKKHMVSTKRKYRNHYGQKRTGNSNTISTRELSTTASVE